MLVGALVLRGDTDDGDGALHVRAVLLDTGADVAAAAGVAATGAVILGTGGWHWLDPAVALAIAGVVGYQTLRLLREVLPALRQPPTTMRGQHHDART